MPPLHIEPSGHHPDSTLPTVAVCRLPCLRFSLVSSCFLSTKSFPHQARHPAGSHRALFSPWLLRAAGQARTVVLQHRHRSRLAQCIPSLAVQLYLHSLHDSFTCYHYSSFPSLQSLMSSRITRASARQAASKAVAQPASSSTTAAAAAAATAQPTATPLQLSSDTTSGLKRKAAVNESAGSSAPSSGSSGRKHKRQKVPDPSAAPPPNLALATTKPKRKDRKTAADMDNQEYVSRKQACRTAWILGGTTADPPLQRHCWLDEHKREHIPSSFCFF